MKITKDMMDDSGRAGYAFALLESSGYVDPWKSEIAYEISESSPDEIELIIQDLLLNQVDRYTNYRNKDIQRRLDIKFDK